MQRMRHSRLFYITCRDTSTVTVQTSFSRTKALVLPVIKDASTKQYITQLGQRIPLVPLHLTLDLGGESLWLDCDPSTYTSSTYRPAGCSSSECSRAHALHCVDFCHDDPPPPLPICNNHTCFNFAQNSVSLDGTSSVPGSDTVYIQSTDIGGRIVSVHRFIFVCPLSSLTKGLAVGVTGMAGLGRTTYSLPFQFSSSFSLARKFSICLSSSPKTKGMVIFGDAPFHFIPNFNASRDLMYTPLIKNPISTSLVHFDGEPSADYFITIKSIKVGGRFVTVNTTLLAIDNEGNGGTKISTVDPYSVLETSIYNALIKTFVDELSIINHVPRAESVAPFGACFKSTLNIRAAVPDIDLVLEGGDNVVWRIKGANSMVRVSNDVVCLAFVEYVDIGIRPKTSIVIGGHQIEDNFLQFDLASSTLGFTSSLLNREITCAANFFYFTSNA